MPIVDYLVQNGSSTGQFSGMPDSIVFLVALGSRSEFTDNVKRLTSRHPDCRLHGGYPQTMLHIRGIWSRLTITLGIAIPLFKRTL